MAISRIFNWFDNVGAPSSSVQFGAFNLGPVNKLHRIRVRGSVVFPNVALTSTSQLANPVVWGIQWGDTGYTPFTLVADADDAHFLAVESHVNDEINVTWAPSTDTSANIVGGPLRLDWAGQLFLGVNADIYLTVSHTFTTALTWATMGTIEALFT